MTSPGVDRALYERILWEIRGRVEEASSLLAEASNLARLEVAGLHLRKVLELIIYGALVNNREAIEALSNAFERKDVGEVRKLARRANPHYWPQGLTPRGIPESLQPGQLAEGEWGRAYGFASRLLHAKNPYLLSDEGDTVQRELGDWFDRIIALLNHHQVRLANEEFLLRCLMKTNDGGLQVALFQRVDSGLQNQADK